jgi:hypothetical protein
MNKNSLFCISAEFLCICLFAKQTYVKHAYFIKKSSLIIYPEEINQKEKGFICSKKIKSVIT